jgi:hypothetical protein
MNDYKTSDIILAACLRLEGYQMTSIDMIGSKGTFVFHKIDADFVAGYDLGQVRVEPTLFNNMVKQLTTSVRRKNQR